MARIGEVYNRGQTVAQGEEYNVFLDDFLKGKIEQFENLAIAKFHYAAVYVGQVKVRVTLKFSSYSRDAEEAEENFMRAFESTFLEADNEFEHVDYRIDASATDFDVIFTGYGR